ncbi:hypothetical protein V8F33_002154 [Rhypophila sp. PSN 637]
MTPYVKEFEPTFSSYDEQMAYWNSREGRYSGPNGVERRNAASTASLRQPPTEYATMERTSSVPDFESRRRITFNKDRLTTSSSLREQPKASSSRQSKVTPAMSRERQPENPVVAPVNSKNEMSQSRGASRSGYGTTYNVKDYLSSAIDREVKFPPLKPPRSVSPPLVSTSHSRMRDTSRPDDPAPSKNKDGHSRTGTAVLRFSTTEERVEWCRNITEPIFQLLYTEILVRLSLPRSDEACQKLRNLIFASVDCATNEGTRRLLITEASNCWWRNTSLLIFNTICCGMRVPNWNCDKFEKWEDDVVDKIFDLIFDPVSSRSSGNPTAPATAALRVNTVGEGVASKQNIQEDCAVIRQELGALEMSMNTSIQGGSVPPRSVIPKVESMAVAKNKVATNQEIAKTSESQKPAHGSLELSGESSRPGRPSTLATTSTKDASSCRYRKASHNVSSHGKSEPTTPAAHPLGRASVMNRTDVTDRPSVSPRLELARKRPTWREREAAAVADWCAKENAKVAAVKQISPIIDNQDASSPQLAATTPIQSTHLRGRNWSLIKLHKFGPWLADGPIGSINKTSNRKQEGVSGDGGSGSNGQEPISSNEKFLRALVKEIKVSGSPMDAAEVANIVDKITTGITESYVHIGTRHYKLSLPGSVTKATVSKLVKLIPEAYIKPCVYGYLNLRLPLPVKTVKSSTVQPTAVETLDAKAHPDMRKSKDIKKDPAINSRSAKTKSTEADNDMCKRTKEEPVANSASAEATSAGAENTKPKTPIPTATSKKNTTNDDSDIDEYVMVEEDVPGGSSYIEDDWLVVAGDDGF